jgi:hypothetical protein
MNARPIANAYDDLRSGYFTRRGGGLISSARSIDTQSSLDVGGRLQYRFVRFTGKELPITPTGSDKWLENLCLVFHSRF